MFFCLTLLFAAGNGVMAQRPLTEHKDGRERDPVLSPAGDELYFTRPDHSRNQGVDGTADIWLRRRGADGRWQRALNPGSPINSFVDDRLLSISPDGNRLAVLRGGALPGIDILERSGRNWRTYDSYLLPQDLRPPYDLTYDHRTESLIYSRRRAGITDDYDLFSRRMTRDGYWDLEEPIAINSPAYERRPNLAADGRTLYFRRGREGRWMRQDHRGLEATEADIPDRFQQVTVGDKWIVGMTNDLGEKDERLFTISRNTNGPADNIKSDSPSANRVAYLRRSIDEEESELARLERQLQRTYTTPTQSVAQSLPDDPLPDLGDPIIDTLSFFDPNDTRARYLDELSELERAKQVFRYEQRQRDLRRTRQRLPARDTAALDSVYARQQGELADLRAQLSQTLTAPPSAPPPPTPPPVITFVEGTSYPDPTGQDALDRLVEWVRAATEIVEIEVPVDSAPTPRIARLLAEERATTIRAYLLEAGLVEERFRLVY